VLNLSGFQDPDLVEPLPDIALLDAKIAEAALAINDAETSAARRKAKERKEDLMRLKRVEQIYVSFRSTFKNFAHL
jgi:hypothetical protein